MKLVEWIKAFLNKDVVKMFFKIVEKIFVGAVGAAGEMLQEYALEAVRRAEASGKSGTDKYQFVFKELRDKFPDVKKGFIDTAIQNSWLALEVYKK